ncbi:hypothetical protein TSTA_099600 [Talaromyces stipitatus ATCC 10500]|uniref:Uncharacterized protein n=1 Tax=Talaromyces stipitatus (strain ATCC 10500 / CBS 375.48 / QM 6759 / NRRL 1006) TaxID=441959 RepID=B8MMF5_TALSN|nr:uncharacterized protein TSTA_099600 [Talaromyces stipitatus ATCC 10500]EED13709.1 hypothetical protein TSTA_099600 [Talaromyces stipitatus ATCC 10500]
MFMCISRFEIEFEQLALLEEYISTQEIQTRTKKKAANKVRDSKFNLISDTEKDPWDIPNQPTQPLTAVALGKRPQQTAPMIDLEEEEEEEEEEEDEEENEEDGTHLFVLFVEPEIQLQSLGPRTWPWQFRTGSTLEGRDSYMSEYQSHDSALLHPGAEASTYVRERDNVIPSARTATSYIATMTPRGPLLSLS